MALVSSRLALRMLNLNLARTSLLLHDTASPAVHQSISLERQSISFERQLISFERNQSVLKGNQSVLKGNQSVVKEQLRSIKSSSFFLW
jgi:hypothetical protein